jgi:hypothetical protein
MSTKELVLKQFSDLEQLKEAMIKNIISVPDHPDPTKNGILKPKLIKALQERYQKDSHGN